MPADLLLLHGFTQTGASWDGVSRALAGRYRALAPDLGAGPWEAELDRLEALAPAEFVLAGYSMGGRLALALALRHPERVRAARARLRVARARGRGGAGSAARGRRGARGRGSRRSGSRRSRASGRPSRCSRASRTAVAALAHADRLRRSAAEHAAQLRGLGTGVMPPLWDRLGELAMPVTLVVGERDTKFRAIAERMPAAARSSWCRAPAMPSRSRRPRRSRRRSPARTRRCPEPLAPRAQRSSLGDVPDHPHRAAWTCRPHLDGGVAAAGARAPRRPRRAGDAAADAARARQHAPHAVGARRGARGRAAALERATAC